MSRATIQWGAQKALERLEWLSKHVRPREGEGDRVADELDELERFLVRVVEFSAPH